MAHPLAMVLAKKKARVSSDSKWKHPSHEDVQEVDPEQIVPCEIKGEWDTVTDVTSISYAFQ